MYSEPYRLFFPLGIFSLFVGIFLWVPSIWSGESYPILLHRSLVLNGFTGLFIGGFLMTAVPQFSKTQKANFFEVLIFFFITMLNFWFAYCDQEKTMLIFSALQPLILLVFMGRRILRRKENPPYSFVFIFTGLFLWLLSSLGGVFGDFETFKALHYEGAIASIILGVGSRLIPGILGHVEIVRAQRERYEKPLPILQTVPWYFYLLILSFVGSYFLPENLGNYLRGIVVLIIGVFYYQLYRLPKIRSSLTWSIWIAGYLIIISFLLKALWPDGMIHAGHSFFINGIVLLSLLIATRVIQSHGPKDAALENWKGLYWVTFLVFFAASTRVSAYLMPETYLRHLGYSAIVLGLALIIWSVKYLKFTLVGVDQSAKK